MAALRDLRAAFQERLNEGDVEFHPSDLQRMKDDKYLLRVLKHCEHDITQATDMLFEIFTWRQMVEANDITEENVRMDYIKEGILYPHGRDIDNCLLLIINCRKHIKGQKDFEEIKRAIIYWFDRIERQENGNKITLFFDLENCGLNNMDMELINYLILLFKSYYPYFLNYIIIYQMPWAMSAAFKLIRSLLPARGVDKMKFVNKDGLKDFINPDQALTAWGGQDDYTFEFVPEKSDPASKKVTFAERENHLGELLSISPSDTIYFRTDKDDITGQFTITNIDESAISFKIRTTAPEKFRVRPSSGTLSSGASHTVVVTIQPGFNVRSTAKDRFLVMAMKISSINITQKDMSELWQNPEHKADEYRLKCYFPEKSKPKNPNELEEHRETKSVADLLHAVDEQQKTLKAKLNFIQKCQYFLIFLTGCAAFFGLAAYLNIGFFCEDQCRQMMAYQSNH